MALRKPEQHAQSAAAPGDNHRCEWEADGKRCCYPGVFSRNTVGGGPWYCREHARDDLDPRTAAQASQAYVPMTPAALRLDWLDRNLPRGAGETIHEYALRCREQARQLGIGEGARRNPFRWAHEILELERAGACRGGAAGVELARKALGIRAPEPPAMREPGEDREEAA